MNKILIKIKRYINNRIVFFSDSKPESFSGDKVEKPIVAVVEKVNFFEIDRYYPISNKIHVVKALKLEADSLCPFKDFNYVFALDKSRSGFNVHFWFFKNELIEKINAFYNKPIKFLVPENYLIFQAIKDKQLVWVEDGHYLVGKTPGITFYNKPFLFEMDDENGDIEHIHLLHKVDKFQLIQSGFFKASSQFFNFKIKNAKKSSDWYLQYAKPVGMVFFGYLLASSLVIKAMDFYYENKLANTEAALSSYREAKHNLKQSQNAYQEYAMGIENYVEPAFIVKVLSQTKSSYIIERISYKGDVVYVTAVSEEPLKTLEEMANFENVSNASFANKVQDLNVKNLKKFTLSFKRAIKK